MKISTSFLDKISYVWLSIPLFIFLGLWLKIYIGLFLAALLFLSLREIFCEKSQKYIEVNKKTLLLIIFVTTLWCISAGIGGFVYQSPDWQIRNAIFRDLINFSFPVQYNNGSALVYYMGAFLPGSLFAKIFLPLDSEIAFNIGNYFTLFYIALGINIIVLQLIRLTKANKKQQLFVLILFIFFSGIDVLQPNTLYNLATLHFERHNYLQYSSFTTLLFWVYNQAVAPWLVTLLFLKNPYKIENYGILGTICMFYSPLAFCGIFSYFVWISVVYLKKSLKTKKFKLFLSKIFSKNNLIILPLIITVYLYFKSNSTVDSEKISFMFSSAKNIRIKEVIELLCFIFMEAGIFFVLMWNKYKSDIVFQITLVLLLVIPMFRVGGCGDFCMRASIPAILILMVFVAKFLFGCKKNICKNIMVAVLLFGALTPCMEFFRCFVYSAFVKKEMHIKDDIKTLDNKIYAENCKYINTSRMSTLIDVTNYCNYGAVEPEKYFFFRYLTNMKNTKM